MERLPYFFAGLIFGLSLFVLLAPETASAAVAYRTAGVSPGASSQTCVITAPTGITIGDELIASCSFDDGAASNVTLAGWTSLSKTQTGTLTVATLYKIADSGDTGAATFTFTTSGSSGSNVGTMIRLDGANGTFDTPQTCTGSGVSTCNNAGSNTITNTADLFVGITGARDDGNINVMDLTTTSGGATASGYTKTERVEMDTTLGNDTANGMSTAVWDGTGTGIVFGSLSRTSSAATMAGQVFIVHATAPPVAAQANTVILFGW